MKHLRISDDTWETVESHIRQMRDGEFPDLHWSLVALILLCRVYEDCYEY